MLFQLCKNDSKNSSKTIVRIRKDLRKRWCREANVEYYQCHTYTVLLRGSLRCKYKKLDALITFIPKNILNIINTGQLSSLWAGSVTT